MKSHAEIEALAIEALNAAVEEGFLLIRGEWGICWDSERRLWVGDSAVSQIAGCDIQGALCLRHQEWSGAHYAEHRGDPVRAVYSVIDDTFYPEVFGRSLEDLMGSKAYVFARNLVNGWDGEGFLGENQEAYLLGQKLASVYLPVEVALTRNIHSEVRLVVPRDAESMESIEYQALVG